MSAVERSFARVIRVLLVGSALALGVGGSVAAAGPTATAPGAPGARASGAPGGTAPGAPGADSYFDLARKDCVGTARNTTSKVWFTVADGVLSDVYWPTIDATNVKTLQYVVSDGHTFTDLQTRDMRYSVSPDASGMSCTVTAWNAAHGYRIVTTYLADPARAAVLMRTTFHGPAGDALYVRLDPLAGGTGGGGAQNGGGNSAVLAGTPAHPTPVAYNTNTTTNATNRTYAVPTYEALDVSAGFDAASVGYASTPSDGLTALDGSHTLSPSYSSAPDGHVTLTARVHLGAGGRFDLALGFGETEEQALRTSAAAVQHSFAAALRRYRAGWARYDARLRRPTGLGASAVRMYYRSINVVKASEDKTFPGAIAAGLASPWGQAVAADTLSGGKPTYFGSYREVFARDLYEAFTGLLVAGDRATAQAATRFLFDRQQQADGSMPRNSLTNGKPAPDTGGLQLDETSYPILMDWQSGLAADAALYRRHVIPAADFLVAHGPSDGVERWEEQTGYSPSTIAAEIAGLTAAAHIARVNGDPARATMYQAVADDFARNVKTWTVTDTGPFGGSYFIRVSKTGDPNAAISYSLGNGSITADQREVIDAGFLELVRLGVLPANDPTVTASLAIVDKTIERSTPSGIGFYRYGTSRPGSEDGYGDCYEPDPTSCAPTGRPWPPANAGSGHLWPVLGGERGEYELADAVPAQARALLQAMGAMTSGHYLEPEQAWEDPSLPASPYGQDPTTASIGFAPGHPAGSASPLTWAQAQYARLALDLSAGRTLETPAIVKRRYVTHGMPGSLPLSITSPTSGTSVSASTVTVSGTTTAGAHVVAEASGLAGGRAAIASAMADGSGDWSIVVPVSFGTTTITVTATRGASTAYGQVLVTDLALPTPLTLDLADPVGDDNGPGTYAYPTDPSFQPGAFDLTGMKVTQDATSVYIQVSIRNLASTFGTAFGAQLLDVYVHDPAATTTSTAAAFPTRNYTIAPADAWSERIEAQGFAAVVWDDPNGNSLGSGQLVVDPTGGTATVVLPRATFGSVGSGWAFTVTLTGQDGFSPDLARAFTATPAGFTFGVCPTSTDTNPICSVSPSAVPKVMDTITPTGVAQSTELDPTLGPVVLHGVSVP